MKESINVFWFRRDLRLNDNAGLFNALQSENPVLLIFIFDHEILDKLPIEDARVSFIHKSLQIMRTNLQENYESDIALFHGEPLAVFKNLTKKYRIDSVYTNHDYEPYALKRDLQISRFLKQNNISFNTYKDHVIFEKNEVVKNDGKPYLVYTPYMKSWKREFKMNSLKDYNSYNLLQNTLKTEGFQPLSLEEIGFKKSKQKIKEFSLTSSLIKNYESTRNFPALESTTRLGPHLRFGTVSVREMVQKASSELNEVFLNELIWREFFIQILWHFPQTLTIAFKPKYDRINWRNNIDEFKLWKQGKTGYPLVDAGMNQLNKTGFMHNRVRMVVSSFLCKHLLIDWRWGEAYFAEKLHDYEMASNVGNWQWVAGCGVDAAPYFRIFNPITQIEKFDKNLEYIKKWIPQFDPHTYYEPIIEHKFARNRCLKTYKQALI